MNRVQDLVHVAQRKLTRKSIADDAGHPAELAARRRVECVGNVLLLPVAVIVVHILRALLHPKAHGP